MTDDTESYDDLRDALADAAAFELAASTIGYTIRESLQGTIQGRQLLNNQDLPDFADTQHPDLYKQVLDTVGYEPFDEIPVEDIADYQDTARQIERTPENVTAFFYLVEDRAMQHAQDVHAALEDTPYSHWQNQIDDVIADEEDEREDFGDLLREEYGWDDVSPDAVEDELGITL